MSELKSYTVSVLATVAVNLEIEARSEDEAKDMAAMFDASDMYGEQQYKWESYGDSEHYELYELQYEVVDVLEFQIGAACTVEDEDLNDCA